MNPTRLVPLSARRRCLIAVAALACLTTAAQARGGWSVDFSVGLPIGQPFGYGYGYGDRYRGWPGGNWDRPWGPRWVLVAPPVVVPLVQAVPLAVQPIGMPSPQPSRPDPVIEPRNGQDAQQTEHDRQQCNRWATTQPAALADAAVFHGAVAACMDGRGYTLR